MSEALRARLGQGGAGGPALAAREAQLVIGIIHHPKLFGRFESEILELTIHDKDLSELLSRTIDALVNEPDLDSGKLRHQLSGWPEAEATYQRWSADPLVKVIRFTKQNADDKDAEAGWHDAFLIDRQHKILSAEVTEAGAEAHKDPGREKIWLDSVRMSLSAHQDNEASRD
ncbi:MAG: hypothetical protein AAF788_06580, partial [Pseudomonadota bacterium]